MPAMPDVSAELPSPLGSEMINSLDIVTNHVDAFLQIDSSFPQLADTLKISQGISISGLSDKDYPNLEQYGNSLKTLSQFTNLKTIPLPKVLTEQFGQMVQRCEMGIFPEIGRAWLAIDTNIFLWKYDTGSDVAYYDALSLLITNVGLVKPKEGVFKPHIKFLLVLVTIDAITLLGLTFSNDLENCQSDPKDLGDLLVIPDPIFTLASDNIEIKVIKGTEDGRIFLGGSDGCLHEICYQADNGWFGHKCRKINHSIGSLSFLVPKILKSSKTYPITQIEIDQTRHILYTLNESGDIEVYDLGSDAKSMHRVFCRTAASISKEAFSAAPTIDEKNFDAIVSINAVEELESIHVNLVAVTKTGVRLYFTTTSLGSPEQRPFTLTLVHIRLPPGFAASSVSHRPCSVHLSSYKKGNFIFISAYDNKDTLWALSNDSFAFHSDLIELYSIIPLNNKIWTMNEEISIVKFKPYSSLVTHNKTFTLEAPSIVNQHLESGKKFVFLTTQGVIVGFKPRVVDQLKQLLLENQGHENEAVKSFFALHQSSPQTNACVLALMIACDNHPPGEERLNEWATSAFFHYGSLDTLTGEHFDNVSLPAPFVSTPIHSPQAGGDHRYFTTPRPGDSISPMLSPIGAVHPTQSLAVQLSPGQASFHLQQYSNRYRALFLYFSRIIRPIWNVKTTSVKRGVTLNDGDNNTSDAITSNISLEEIKIYLIRLTSLHNFIQNNMKLAAKLEFDKFALAKVTVAGHSHGVEQSLIFSLFKLIEHCIEVLNLWKLLCIHQFHTIVASLSKEKQTHLLSVTFKEVIVYGSEITTLLASSLVRRFIEDNNTTDIINKRLQDVCPSIYKHENALHAKAHEMVLKARSLSNENDRKLLLNNALEMCKKIGPRINLGSVCELFQTVQWYEAIVDICLTTALKRDPQNIALHYYKNRDAMEDLNGKALYESRLEAYKHLLDIYHRLTLLSKSMLSPRVPASSHFALSPEDAKRESQTMLRLATQSKDELFHYILYSWLYEHGQSDRLLEIKSSYLEAYLKEKTSEFEDSIALLDFLWMYYERNAHFTAAAEILHKLADQQSADIGLVRRIEYLSRAIVCMKSLDAKSHFATSSHTAGELLHVLEEKMDVARLQLQLLTTLEKMTHIHNYEDVLRSLNSNLHDVTTLYQQYAQPFELFEIQIKILYCAGHEDVNLNHNVWKNILEKEILAIANKDADSQFNILRNKIKELATFLMNDDKFFPKELIIHVLESFTAKQQPGSFEPTWLARTFLDLNVDLLELFEIYHNIYQARANPANDLIHLLEVIVFLIQQSEHSHMNYLKRERFVSKCLDVISAYLIDIKTFDMDDPRVKRIHQQLKFLERSLK